MPLPGGLRYLGELAPNLRQWPSLLRSRIPSNWHLAFMNSVVAATEVLDGLQGELSPENLRVAAECFARCAGEGMTSDVQSTGRRLVDPFRSAAPTRTIPCIT